MCIALLVSLGLAALAERSCPFYLAQSKFQYTRWTLEDYEGALEQYRKEKGALPATLSLLYPDRLKVLRHDAWSQAYVYRIAPTVGKGFVLYSLGANGVDEHGGGDDVTVWRKGYTCAQYQENCWSACESTKAFAYICSLLMAVATGSASQALDRT